jgi:hypothetical protein
VNSRQGQGVGYALRWLRDLGYWQRLSWPWIVSPTPRSGSQPRARAINAEPGAGNEDERTGNTDARSDWADHTEPEE